MPMERSPRLENLDSLVQVDRPAQTPPRRSTSVVRERDIFFLQLRPYYSLEVFLWLVPPQ